MYSLPIACHALRHASDKEAKAAMLALMHALGPWNRQKARLTPFSAYLAGGVDHGRPHPLPLGFITDTHVCQVGSVAGVAYEDLPRHGFHSVQVQTSYDSLLFPITLQPGGACRASWFGRLATNRERHLWQYPPSGKGHLLRAMCG